MRSKVVPRVFVFCVGAVVVALTQAFAQAPPATAVRLGPTTAACNVAYPDTNNGSKSIKWDTEKQTFCGFEATEISRSQGARWWWSARQNGVITISYECNSGPFFDQWGSWTEVQFSALVVPGKHSEGQLKEMGCVVPEYADACVCTKDNPKKVEDCYKSGGNCLGQISTVATQCVVDAAACSDSKFTKDCKTNGGTLLLIHDSPFCRK